MHAHYRFILVIILPLLVLTSAQAAVSTKLLTEIQANLKALGYNPGSADGHMGSRTQKAIRDFQKNHRLAVTGKPSRELAAQLNKALTRRVQVRLKTLGYNPGSADGHMGSRTQKAIRDFQKKNGLLSTGKVSRGLLTQLERASQSGTRTSVQADLKGIQAQLKALGYNPGSVDGKMGSRTRKAIRNFQKREGLPVNDKVSKPFRIRLDQVLIQRTQSRLRALGYKPGPADGKMGLRTRQAIRSFQKKQGLKVTGRVSADLLTRLKRARKVEVVIRDSKPALKLPETPVTMTSTGKGRSVSGPMKFRYSANRMLVSCSVGQVKLDLSWCRTFVSARHNQCKVTLRSNSDVLAVKCR